ncbi:MAG: stage II sporulation protein R [Christensenellales bacterium]
MKKTVWILWIACLCLMMTSGALAQRKPGKTAPEAQDIVRLHVIANSDSDEDQALKLMVRDEVNRVVAPLVAGVSDQEEALEIVSLNTGRIQEAARAVMAAQGKDMAVLVQMGKREFPSRLYDGVIYPEGRYDALCVTLGEGKGQNWWCVIFPPLCFVNVKQDDAVREDDMEIPISDGQLYMRSFFREKFDWHW